NLAVDGGATSVDWNSFTATTHPAGYDAITIVPDLTGNPDDIFNGGVKQDDNCPGTKDGSLGGGNGKFDMERLYLTHHKVDATHDYLFLAWERVPSSATASAHI